MEESRIDRDPQSIHHHRGIHGRRENYAATERRHDRCTHARQSSVCASVRERDPPVCKPDLVVTCILFI